MLFHIRRRERDAAAGRSNGPSASRLPVMVWFVEASLASASPTAGPEALAAEGDLIVVTVQYRWVRLRTEKTLFYVCTGGFSLFAHKSVESARSNFHE
jgi:hypothetical protein